MLPKSNMNTKDETAHKKISKKQALKYSPPASKSELEEFSGSKVKCCKSESEE